MENKLFSLLKILKSKSQKQLQLFLVSPFFAVNEEAARLVVYYLKSLEKGKIVEEETTFAHLFLQQGFDKARLHRVRSLAFDAVEQFLIYERIRLSVASNKLHLLDFYVENHFPKNYESTLKEIQQELSAANLPASEHFFHQFQVEEKKIHYLSQNYTRSDALEVTDCEENLATFTLLKQLELLTVRFNNNQIFNHPIDEKKTHLLLQSLQNHPFLVDYPILRAYYFLLHLYIQPSNQFYFEQLWVLLLEKETQFSVKDIKHFYTLLRNYCIQKRSIEGGIYLEKLFQLYELQLSKGWLYDNNGKLAAATFKNIVVVGLRLQKEDFIADFIANYAAFLPLLLQETVKTYCLGQLYFHQKNFPLICKLLANSQAVDIFFEIDTRRLLMKTYYEMQEWDSLMDAINRFRVFLTRNKRISEAHQKSNLHFATLLAKCMKLQSGPFLSPQLLEVRQLLHQLQPIADKEWLWVKVEDLQIKNV